MTKNNTDLHLYKKEARQAIRDFCLGEEKTDYYISKINAATKETEIIAIMRKVREEEII